MYELGSKKLQLGYWWVTHRQGMRFILLIVWLFFDILLTGFALLQVTLYVRELFISNKITADITNNTLNYREVRKFIEPQKPVIGSIQSFLSDVPGKIDVATKVENPNEFWRIDKLSYQFIIAGKIFEEETIFLKPQKSTVIVHFGIPGVLDENLKNTVKITEIEWKNTKKLETLDTEVTISEPEYKRIKLEDASGIQSTITQVKTQVKNKGIYGFWDAAFLILLRIDEEIIAAKKARISPLKVDTEYTIEVQWNRGFAPSAEVQIIPVINTFDPENIIL
ncbi:MAG: hypothetical protein A3B74_04030 [Candidatus Kerfeldbacteria bacterium RIFCSPHIGHO2_02_FULL_42_14]|uniref:Uncharacterized protein n=1 Tax=Candidatus Kerfeldbacteria bacterium RIFCSPHIGHO2_02_FULL_42_14 TaxID=1798540 RepID=A0A1G2AQW5_9BACT|nr:MAG: hypothetical protein A3B74_04030 [Candidatus Kerfeldbacteria bacterium RIFCSPHIGHO2_02_FULL_42_14]OGY80678.1 MAG: hypothetical protein A3E60_04525 [Candidatus Kerfeldbacteria bacterium RIFCSPHIGHO2_12_FULL_42_13]OGY82605.1 MAG: hypothetical protein A3I91_04190 [Candidatus Kerfeldbacteria bacterium RIFCSPLOWO2_02_FULL_42_19]OGY85208.1 MAG: hypothetical protein A3G01_01320 [Candidatus Kerfeldbacteria bacterium RIFCSPLOWO2_12_FULL_43_9]